MKLEPSKIFGGSEKGYMYYRSGQMKYGEAMDMKFSCPFDYNHFPFDSHKCCIEYGDNKGGSKNVIMNHAIVAYGSKTTRDGPFEINGLTFPFQLEVESMPTSNNFNADRKKKFSFTGMCFKITRTTRGHLISGYYYPTASFAFLSTISYLIQPDMVLSILMSVTSWSFSLDGS